MLEFWRAVPTADNAVNVKSVRSDHEDQHEQTGDGGLARMLSLICVGDFSSIYLAILRGVDPTPVLTIDRLKKEIGKLGIREKVIGELKKLS